MGSWTEHRTARGHVPAGRRWIVCPPSGAASTEVTKRASTNGKTLRRGERGASRRREPLPGGFNRLAKAVPFCAGDHLVLSCFEEHPHRGQRFGFAGDVEFAGDRQQNLNEVMQLDGSRPFPPQICAYLSAVFLGGLILNAGLGW